MPSIFFRNIIKNKKKLNRPFCISKTFIKVIFSSEYCDLKYNMRLKHNRMCKCINEKNNIKYLHYNLLSEIILRLPSFFTTVASCLGTVNLSIASCVFDVVWSSSLRRNIWNCSFDTIRSPFTRFSIIYLKFWIFFQQLFTKFLIR